MTSLSKTHRKEDNKGFSSGILLYWKRDIEWNLHEKMTFSSGAILVAASGNPKLFALIAFPQFQDFKTKIILQKYMASDFVIFAS